MCATRACPRGVSLPHCPPNPTWSLGGMGVFCLSLVGPPLRPTLPALPPFRPSTRFLPSTADCHSGVLFPGRGDLSGEGTATGSGPRACSPHHAALTRGRHACGTRAQKPSSPGTGLQRGNLPVLPAPPLQALLLSRFFQNPNSNLPCTHLQRFRAFHRTPSAWRRIV